MKRWVELAVGGMLLGVSAMGCGNRTTIYPNPDPALRQRGATEFAADAAKRHPFKADAPAGGMLAGRAEVNYGLDLINMVNLSDQDWQDVEVWVNRQYVIHLPSMPKGVQKTANFQMIFDDKGKSFPLDNRKTYVQRIDLYMDGKIYELPLRLAD